MWRHVISKTLKIIKNAQKFPKNIAQEFSVSMISFIWIYSLVWILSCIWINFWHSMWQLLNPSILNTKIAWQPARLLFGNNSNDRRLFSDLLQARIQDSPLGARGNLRHGLFSPKTYARKNLTHGGGGVAPHLDPPMFFHTATEADVSNNSLINPFMNDFALCCLC